MFGEHEAHVLSSAVRVLETKTKKVKRNKWRRAIFLPYNSMCKRYPVLKWLPIALPVLWIVRWIEAVLFKRTNIRKTLEDISLLEDEKINEQQAKLESVGLGFHFKD